MSRLHESVHGLASTGSVVTDPLVGGSRLPARSALLPSAEVSTGGPRPQTPESRTEFLKVRLTHEEKELLKDQSARTGRCMSDILRSAWKKLKIIELPPADFAEAVIQLRRIGNNLNQVARAANTGEVHIPEIQTVLSEIVAVDRNLSKILSGGGLKWL